MKISLAKFVCNTCGNAFEAPMLNELSYGEFLLRSSTGSVAYMNAFEDRTYMEVKKTLEESYLELRTDPFKTADVLQSIFGRLACDPDSSGEPYMIDALPVCDKCSGRNVESWGIISPQKVVDLDIPNITHTQWNKMTDSEKSGHLARSVSESGFSFAAQVD